MDEQKKTITVTIDQHDAITSMKHGKDTYYDVIDRLIAGPNLDELEVRAMVLSDELTDLQLAIRELGDELHGLYHKMDL